MPVNDSSCQHADSEELAHAGKMMLAHQHVAPTKGSASHCRPEAMCAHALAEQAIMFIIRQIVSRNELPGDIWRAETTAWMPTRSNLWP